MNRLISLIVEDFQAQREGFLSQGFWVLLVYRLSHPRIYCKVRPLRVVWYVVNLLSQKLIEMITGITIPETVRIGRRLQIEHFGGIILHGSVVIGDDCLIRHGVTLGNRRADAPTEAPTLGNHVDIGAGAKILGAVTLGDRCRIGANTVVTLDVPADAIAVGVPARIRPTLPADAGTSFDDNS